MNFITRVRKLLRTTPSITFILPAFGLCFLFLLPGYIYTGNKGYTNQIRSERMLLVIQAPSINDNYYKKHFRRLLEFDIRYAKAVIGHDNVLVLADADTMPHLKGKLPPDVLLESNIEDIWLRDFTSVHPERMVRFKYERSGAESHVQKSFLRFAARHKVGFRSGLLKVDGGNVVDNGGELIIMTNKVFERNSRLSEAGVLKRLKFALSAKRIAIIPMDDEYLGHADGMVMFTGPRRVLMNRFPEDPRFYKRVKSALQKQLPGVNIADIPGASYGKQEGEKYGPYASACGIYVNAAVTYKYIYTPTFGMAADRQALKVIRAHTDKTVIAVPAGGVCKLGGSVRCLTWQVTGENAAKLIRAARSSL